jgi:ABC-type glycerol-3-phosphate transport system substrate-binding protein
MKAHQLPDLLEVQDTESGHLMATHGLLRPINEVLPLFKSNDFNFLLPPSAGFLRDAKGHVEGFPLVLGVPVLLYNRDAYQKVGLDPDLAPRTWRDLQGQLVKLKDEGRGPECAYTTSRPWYIHVVNVAATNGAIFATHDNGMDNGDAVLTFNDLLHVRHIAMTESWIHGELFKYFGHGNEGDAKFASGECLTLTTSTDSLGDIMSVAKFYVGAAPLLYYQEETDGPKNPLVNGSGLYALQGKKPEQYRAVAHFLGYLASPVVAAAWTQETGSLPINAGALAASEKSDAYTRVPGLLRLMRAGSATPTPGSRGIRLPELAAVRDATDAELELVWGGQKPAKQGLDDAVRQGDQLMHHAPAAARAKS